MAMWGGETMEQEGVAGDKRYFNGTRLVDRK
jgi:hypothetical protein